MAIITQASLTKFRSLKYGQDEPGGGSSGEPYVTQDIPPALKQQVDSTTIWNSDNGLIRGGFTGATRASALDTIRIGKFLKDPPRGPLFIAKQVGLQLSNPKQETRKSNLPGILGFFANIGNKIVDTVGSTRIYNLGINTLAQVPVNAFGGHIVRHGFLPVLFDSQKYANVVYSNDSPGTGGVNNRLVLLKAKLEQYPNSNIDSYVSGPGSVDGIGTTTIKRYVNTLSNPQFNGVRNIQIPTNFIPGIVILSAVNISKSNIADQYKRPTPDIDYFLAQGVSEQYFEYNIDQIYVNNNITTGSFTSPPSQIDQNVIDYSTNGRLYNKLKNTIDIQNNNSKIASATIVKHLPNTTKDGINVENQVSSPIIVNITGKSTYNNINNPNGLDLSKFNLESRIGISGQKTSDQINLTPLYISTSPPGTKVNIDGQEKNVRDLIKFRIEAVDGDNTNSSTWMIFRSYLKNITDNPNPSWNTVNYVGRGEPFYIYKGFERSLSFDFQVAAMSEDELKVIWQKLNYLYSNTMPDYKGNVMRGPYMKLTVGNYLYRQPGVIKSLTYTIGNDTPWEIAIDDPEHKGNLYELPHVMNISMTFAPTHDFLPRKFPQVYDDNLQNIPAFVVDRETRDAENNWLKKVYGDNKSIPSDALLNPQSIGKPKTPSPPPKK